MYLLSEIRANVLLLDGTDAAEERTWLHYNGTQMNVDDLPFGIGEPNLSTDENCLGISWNVDSGLVDIDCSYRIGTALVCEAVIR